ncbi:hypothetical protein SDC9_11688 [bioreactor metagenome]|uniref:Uncharacterized protein n=1 Tax=bioreactor metagenome TaxID=1076179 RepID=A0A644TGN3_9ZZZZ
MPMNRVIGEVDLATINGGALIDLFQEQWKRLVANIADINTKPDAVREISIKIKVKPDKSRRNATSQIHCEAKLPTVQDHESFIFFEKEGEVLVAYPDDPRQQVLPGIEELQPGTKNITIQ